MLKKKINAKIKREKESGKERKSRKGSRTICLLGYQQ